jgi:hypothetical protein
MAVLQQIGFDGGVGATKVVTLPQATAAGSTILVVSGAVSVTPSGVPTDNQANTWPAAVLGPTSSQDITVWLLQNCPAGITAITVHHSASKGWIVEESGLLAACFDKSASQSIASTNVSSGNTATLSQANEVCYGFTAIQNGVSYMFSAGSGWDASAFTNYGGPGAPYTPGNQGNTLEGDIIFIERKVVSATTAVAATMTQSLAGTVDAAIITLMQGSVIPPPTPVPPSGPMPRRVFILP